MMICKSKIKFSEYNGRTLLPFLPVIFRIAEEAPSKFIWKIISSLLFLNLSASNPDEEKKLT